MNLASSLNDEPDNEEYKENKNNLLDIDQVGYVGGNKYTAAGYKSSAVDGRKSRVTEHIDARAYLMSHQFGNEDIDSEDEDDPALVGRDLATQKRLKSTAILEEVSLLGPMATAFSLFKGFVATGILYMPGNFIKSGWLFSSLSMFMALLLTIYCTRLLLITRAAMGNNLSFSEMGFKLLGVKGQYMVDVTLVSSQFSFCCAYVYFIASNAVGICAQIQMKYYNVAVGDVLSDQWKWVFGLICFCIFVPLVFIRKVEKLAVTHLFGDVMILFTVVVIMTYASVSIANRGFQYTNDANESLQLINWTLFPNAIGFSVFAYEGVGIIIPVYEITRDKENYFSLVVKVLFFIAFLYMSFSLWTCFAYGIYNETSNIQGVQVLITESLPQSQVFVWVVEILFMLNLIFSFPLAIYPANTTLEKYMFKGWEKSSKRMWCKNLSRAIVAACAIVFSCVVYNQLDYFLSVSGALFCTPIAFILPIVFHYYAGAKSEGEKKCDLGLIVLTTFIMVFCTIWAIGSWILAIINGE